MKKSFCLDSVTSFKDINMSPLNRSSSKNLWSFCKDSRFKKPTVYCDSIYDKPSIFSAKKGAGMGYGKKTDFTKDFTSSPGSTKYYLKTLFDQNRLTKRGFSIYENRQKIRDKGHIPLDPLKVPGPGRYENMKIDRGLSYTMKSRTKLLDKSMTIDALNNNPGPGRYENPEQLSPRGSYSLSKHKDTGKTVFNPKSSIRFFQFKNKNPGPGVYQSINDLSNEGHYPITKSKGHGKRLFDKQMRQIKFESDLKHNKNPGPGSYRLPSDFGHYDGDITYKRGNAESLQNSVNLDK